MQDDKYVTIERLGEERVRSRHATLGREVEMHEFRTEDWSPHRHSAFQCTASRLASLDHPCLPHLIDCLNESKRYQLIVETTASTNAWTKPFLDTIADFVAAADALAHASERDVAHGALRSSDFQQDDVGDLKLGGLGLVQLRTDANVAELRRSDLKSLGKIMLSYLHAAQSRNASAEDEGERADEQGPYYREVQDIVDEIMADRTTDVAEFRDQLKSWLRAAREAEEARSLEVIEEDSPVPPSKHQRLVMAACGIAIVAVVLLLCVVFWPSDRAADSTTAEKSSSPRSSLHEAPASSPLTEVGVINNPEVDEPDESPPPVNTKPLADATSSNSELPTMERGGKEVDEMPDPPTSQPPQTDPFALLPDRISLPPRERTESVQIGRCDLSNDTEVEWVLWGGAGAHRSATFSLQRDSDDPSSHLVLMTHGNETSRIAKLRSEEGAVSFAWLPEARQAVAAGYIQNTLIELRLGRWNATVALRKPISLPPFRFDLERPKSYDIPIDVPPSMEDVSIEFTPMPNSRAKALPSNRMSAVDGMMRIGLDDGNDSKVVLEVESLMRSRRKLRVSPFARLTEKGQFVPVRVGAGVKLEQDLRATALAIRKMQSGLDRIEEDGPKALMRANLRSARAQLARLREFQKNYAVAKRTRLQLHFYRSVGRHRISLVEFRESL